MKKIVLILFVAVLFLSLVNTLQADPKAGKISLGVYSTGISGMAAVGFGIGDTARIDVGLGSMSFGGGTPPITVAAAFYYNFNPRAQNVMHAIATAGVTFWNNTSAFAIGGGMGWECFINRDFSVNADVIIGEIAFGSGSSTFSILKPSISAHYYF